MLYEIRKLPWMFAIVCLVLAAGIVGCGEALVPVTGKVSYKGEPVKGGTLVFSPDKKDVVNAGTPATATIEENGTFILKTENGAGAVVGKYKVSYTSPP